MIRFCSAVSWRRRSSICASIVSSIASSAGTTGPSPAVSGPPSAGGSSKSNSPRFSCATSVSCLPSASRRINWACMRPTRVASADDLVVDVLLDAGEVLALRGEVLVPARHREFAERALPAPAAAGKPGAADQGEHAESGGGIREQALHGHNGSGPLGALPEPAHHAKKSLSLQVL